MHRRRRGRRGLLWPDRRRHPGRSREPGHPDAHPHGPAVAGRADRPTPGNGATGPHDVDFRGLGNGYVTIGLGSNPANRLNLGPAGDRFARLLRFRRNGQSFYEDDLGAFEALANPDGGLADSNPFGLQAVAGRQVYADAGGNALNAVNANGSIVNLAVFPDRLVQNPFAPPGNLIPMQAVPTGVAKRGGYFYVGQLTGFPFPVGGANVYRVSTDGGAPEVFASGFTNIIDLAFGPDGSLYVLEISANGLLSGDPAGALIKIAEDGTRTTIASAGLIAPAGVAVGRNGAIYVTNFSVVAGGGQVIRVGP